MASAIEDTGWTLDSKDDPGVLALHILKAEAPSLPWETMDEDSWSVDNPGSASLFVRVRDLVAERLAEIRGSSGPRPVKDTGPVAAELVAEEAPSADVPQVDAEVVEAPAAPDVTPPTKRRKRRGKRGKAKGASDEATSTDGEDSSDATSAASGN